MYRELGLFFVLLLPVLLLYLSKQDGVKAPGKSKKSRKKNKNKATKAPPTLNENGNNDALTLDENDDTSLEPLPSFVMRRYRLKQDRSDTSPPPSSTDSGAEDSMHDSIKSKQGKSSRKLRHYPSTFSTPTPKPPRKEKFPPLVALDKSSSSESTTTQYSRVLRIQTQPAKPVARTLQKEITQNEPLTKKQRQNQARSAKQKDIKAQADALQEERLRQHQSAKSNTGEKKKTMRGSPVSSKRPMAKASLNEFGQLVWD